MNYSIKRRLWAIVLVLALIVPMMPTFVIPANAAGTLTVTDANIGLEWTDASNSSGKASWSASGNTVTGTATGYTALFFGRTISTKLTITNNHSDDRTLSFDYTLTGGGGVSGIISGTSGSYSDTLAAGAFAIITLTSPSGTSTNTLTLSGLQLLSSGNVTSTFLAPENGSYTVDGTAVTVQTTKEKATSENYTLNATPASGYKFFGWWSEASQSYVSYDNPASVKFGSDPQLKPVFIGADTALFGVGAARFADLTEAANYASTATTKTIVLLNNGTLRGEHTIPAGVTLLIPFDDSNTLYTHTPACTSSFGKNEAWKEPTPFRTLTMAADAKITVDGAMSLSAKHAAANGGANYCGSPTGPVSFVAMKEGANITVNNGGKLYAWGFITGSGSVTANPGATVYENFQITDFRGGSATMSYANNGLAFPLNQYYVQNIEVPVTFYAGASEKIYTSAYSSGMCLGGEATFIGAGGMFTCGEGGYVVKDFDESRDRLNVDLYGSCELNSMTVELSIEVNSANYLLPITNNVSINIHSGTTTLKQSVALLPGVEVTVDQGATLDLAYSGTAINDFCADGYNIIVYDRDEWLYGLNMESGDTVTGVKYGNVLHSSASVPNGYSAKPSYFVPVLYAPGRTGGRTDADLKDAVLDINGTLVANGFVYTTFGGAAIKSTGKTGTIQMVGGSGFDMMTCQNNGTTSTTLAIMIHSADLMNGDGTYLNTITLDEDFSPITYAEPGTTYEYCATHDCWYTDECAKCNAGYKVTWIVNGEEVEIDESVTGLPEFDGTITVPDGKHFSGWDADDDGEVDISIDVPTADMTIVAIFEACYDNNKDHKCDRTDCGKTLSKCADNDNNHNCDVCNEPLSTCADNDNNHNCDVCDKPLSTCADNDNNHNCDVCDKPLSTCADNDNNHNCDVCDKPLSTCADKVNDGDHNCDVCKKILSTCEDKDNDGDHKCDECGTDNVSEHTEGTPVKENIEEAKCEIAGKYDSVVYCTECGDELSRTNDLPIDALEHDWYDPTYTWSEDGKSCTAERTCKRDGSHKETKTVTATGVVTTDPTCTEMGTTTYTANFDAEWAEQQTTTRDDVPAKDHAWTVSYKWSTDGKSCTATRACANDAKHNQIETVTATGVVTTDPTCTAMGVTTYTANFTAEWAEQQTTTHDDVPAKDHAWTVSYSWSEDGKSCTATRTCGNDAEHNLTETVTATGVVTTPATCEEMGTTTYTANFDAEWAVDGKTTTRTDVAKEEHDFNTKASNQQATAADCENAATYYVQCDNCDAVSTDKTVAVGEANGHTGGTATCTTKAICSECGTEYGDYSAHEYMYPCDPYCYNCYDLTNPEATHSIIYVEAKPGTDCQTYDGNKEYWTCSYCRVVWTDENLMSPTNMMNIKVNGEHKYEYDCSKNCKVCNEETRPNADHDYTTGNSPYTCICGDVKQFKVYWYDSNSNLLGTSLVDYGAPLPACPYAPTIPEGFYGVGWTDKFTGEAAPETMPANAIHLGYSINPIKYTVTFLYENGETWQVLNALHGQVIKDLAENYPYPETKVGHTFIGWGVKNAETDEIELVTEMTATGALTLYPVFKVNSYTLEVYVAATGEFVDLTAEYGANLMDVLAEATAEGKIPDRGEYVRIDDRNYNGYNIPTDSEYFDQAADTWIRINELTVMPGNNIEIYQNCDFYGWHYNFNYDSETEVEYYDKDDGVIDRSGWYYIEEDFDDVEGGAWYYFEEVSSDDGPRYFRAEGVTRADYPNDAINGITYGPDARDLGKEDYPDTESALFVFDEDGKFQSDLNGLTADNNWAVNGMLPWFVGLVEVDGDYYYFGANNIMVTPSHRTKGKIYLSRDSRTNVEEDDLFVENGIYFFGDDGKLIKNDGIAEMNGKLYYFIDYRLALGAGLVKENDNFYYVRSTGELVVNQSYWIYNVNEYTDIHVGIYTFDENGVMKVNSIKNGIYEEDGGLFYYENGKRAYKGLMEYEGSYIYVRSKGQLATGKYWITRTNDIKGFAKGTYVFGADGKMLNGVVDGYYYENGKLAYKGLMEYEGSYIYVRSNGKLATGLYWINKTNKLAPIGKYDFGDDGKMIIDELPAYHNGVVDGYYYVDGVLQKGAGPIIWEENIYYVRSNGQVATGSYWTTVENEILSSGRHTFDKDGKLITE